MVIDILRALFGASGNVVRETAEVFRVNAEAADQRRVETQRAALDQMAAEFQGAGRSPFDRIIDGLNRIPRPAMALGTLALFIAAMADPLWFGERMAGLALVPDPLWWLLGAIVSFYFGARHQAKGQEFQRDLVARMASMPARPASQAEPVVDPPGPVHTDGNAALEDWQRHRRSR